MICTLLHHYGVVLSDESYYLPVNLFSSWPYAWLWLHQSLKSFDVNVNLGECVISLELAGPYFTTAGTMDNSFTKVFPIRYAVALEKAVT